MLGESFSRREKVAPKASDEGKPPCGSLMFDNSAWVVPRIRHAAHDAFSLWEKDAPFSAATRLCRAQIKRKPREQREGLIRLRPHPRRANPPER